MITSIETRITPSKARDLLSKNNHNRDINKRKLKSYTDALLYGEWQFNGEAIIVADNGDVMNGQHRLYACINSNKSFDTILTEGIDRNNFGTIDTGKSRSGSDVLNIMGIKGRKARDLSACAPFCILFERGCKPHAFGLTENKHQHLITPKRRADWVIDNPYIIEISKKLSSFGQNKVGIPASYILFLWFFMDKKDRRTEEFFRGVIQGTDLYTNDPRMALRNKIANLRLKNIKITKIDMLGFIISCWSSFCKGRVLKANSGYFKPCVDMIEEMRPDRIIPEGSSEY